MTAYITRAQAAAMTREDIERKLVELRERLAGLSFDGMGGYYAGFGEELFCQARSLAGSGLQTTCDDTAQNCVVAAPVLADLALAHHRLAVVAGHGRVPAFDALADRLDERQLADAEYAESQFALVRQVCAFAAAL